jgi:hypothetical protein
MDPCMSVSFLLGGRNSAWPVSLFRNSENRGNCCATMTSHCQCQVFPRAVTLDSICVTMTYMMWCEEHLWKVSVLQKKSRFQSCCMGLCRPVIRKMFLIFIQWIETSLRSLRCSLFLLEVLRIKSAKSSLHTLYFFRLQLSLSVEPVVNGVAQISFSGLSLSMIIPHSSVFGLIRDRSSCF